MSLDMLTNGFHKAIIAESDSFVRGQLGKTVSDLGLEPYFLGVDLPVKEFVHYSSEFLKDSFVFSSTSLDFDKSTLQEFEENLGESPTCSRAFDYDCCKNLSSKVSCMFYRLLVSQNFPVDTNFVFINPNSDFATQMAFENGGKGRFLERTAAMFDKIRNSFNWGTNPGVYWLELA